MPGVRTSRRTRLGVVAALAAVAGLGSFAATADPIDDLLSPTGVGDLITRPGAAPVVLTGAQLPSWSRLPAVGVHSSAELSNFPGEGRDAHYDEYQVPADARAGVRVDDIAAFRWENGRFVEIPMQVDERFPYLLENFSSDFGVYSRHDPELTYAWDTESWRKTAGVCATEYPPGVGAMADPVATLDDDDEIVFMPGDAGEQAPADARGPVGSGSSRQEIAVADPLTGATRFLYLFTRAGGSSFDDSNGYVRYERDANADEWIDRSSFADTDPEKLGTSNTGYGPNLAGTVCRDGEVQTSTDRFPRDGVTVKTDAYEWRATGRWMVRGMRVAKPGQPGVYGPDLIDRWKGRAFQQSPDSTVSLVGFEDEQVNWEANSALLGERRGPVRAIREVWGADSGTNVTKTETFYRDAITYRYRLRVHPIPPDGLYTSWDYNAGVASTYYTPTKPGGVAIDGMNDDVGNVDSLAGTPAFFDAPDPALNVPLSLLTWEQVSGAGDAGSLVYLFENKGPTSLTEPTVVPYYRDDACLDDGTGDDPVARPWPGEASTDSRVRDGYSAIAGKPYEQLVCADKQGAWGSHGVHFFVTSDTDNAFLPTPVPVNEVDAQQWQFAVPTGRPTNIGDRYSVEVRAPLVAAAREQASQPLTATSLVVAAPSSVQLTDGLDVAIELRDAPAGSEVAVAFGEQTRSVTVDEAGRAEVRFAVAGVTGTRAVTARYAGDAAHAASGDERMVDVVRDDARITGVIANGVGGKRVDVRLTDADDGRGLAGRAVEFVRNGTSVGTAWTNATGVASLPVKLDGNDVVEVRFAGDDTYSPASNRATRA